MMRILMIPTIYSKKI